MGANRTNKQSGLTSDNFCGKNATLALRVQNTAIQGQQEAQEQQEPLQGTLRLEAFQDASG
jgi:hypothetical protein